MNQQERAILIWSVFFLVSGIVFISAFLFSPVIGAMLTMGYILLYIGVSAVFMIVFREISAIKTESIEALKDKKDELLEIERALKSKFLRKRLDEKTYTRMKQDYEKLITEIEVRIKRLERRGQF